MAAFGDYALTLVFEDERQQRTRRTLDLDVPTGLDRAVELDSAANLADGIVEDYKAVTTAGLVDAYLTFKDVGANPWADTTAQSGSEVSNEAVISTYLLPSDPAAEDVGPEYWILRVPSPIDAIFESDLITVDRNNALLQALVDEIEAAAHVSDEEKIDLTSGINGMKSGKWISKARKPK